MHVLKAHYQTQSFSIGGIFDEQERKRGGDTERERVSDSYGEAHEEHHNCKRQHSIMPRVLFVCMVLAH